MEPIPAREVTTPIDQEPEVPYERITLAFDRNHPISVAKYKCDNCGSTAFRHYMRLKFKTPGRPGFAGPIVEVQCHARMKRKRDDGTTVNVFCKQRYYLTF